MTPLHPKCCAPACDKEAGYEVILYDIYLDGGGVFFEQDYTCPFLCEAHVLLNEAGAEGVRRPRGHVTYPYTNRHRAQGFTIYKPIEG